MFLSPQESSVFFNTLSDRFYQKAELIIEKQCDLRPILSMVLLGMQEFQFEKTKIDALKCIKFLADINQGHFRQKIWSWIKFTTIKNQQPPIPNLDKTRSGRGLTMATANQVNVNVRGFIQSISELMSVPGASELNMLACRCLV